MKQRLQTFLDTIDQTNDLATLQAAIFNMRAAYGVEHVVYHSVRNNGQQYAALTYPKDWVDHYIDESLEKVDPVVKGCFKNFMPLDWKRLDWSNARARTLLMDAIATGIGNQGVSVPIHGPSGQFALFTINDTSRDGLWAKFTQKNLRDIVVIAHCINEKARLLEGHPKDAHMVKSLSPRETDTLVLLASGLSRTQAAERLKISEHTLRVYIEAARLKLGAKNTVHAVANAVVNGLICF